MLSIKPIKSSRSVLAYYANLGREDYYANGTEPPGLWWGDGAAAFGLSGSVNAQDFGNILLGLSADGKKELVQNAGHVKRLSAFDLNWSVPKSVSAAWSQGGRSTRKKIEAAGMQAVRKSLDLFQELCGVSRRGKLGRQIVQGKLVGAIFQHETARGIQGDVPDCQLHWHTVIANIVIRDDGTTGAFDARGLFKKNMKMALGAMFRAELCKELEEIGLLSYRPPKEYGEGPVSWFELEVVPSELVRAMSKRRQEIEKWLAKRGLSGAKNAELAAQKTRRAKEHWSRGQLFASWNDQAAKFGFYREDLDTYVRDVKPPNRIRELESRDAIHRAIEQIIESDAHFTEIDLLRFAAEEAQTCGIGISDVRSGVRDCLEKSPQIVRLRELDGESQYTTYEMFHAVEKPLLDGAKRLSLSSTYRVKEQIIAKVVRHHTTLRPEQLEAIRYLTTGRDMSCVVGIAGSGKTFALKVAKECWEQSDFSVVGTTLSAKASQVLEDGSAIKSIHLHRLFIDLAQERISKPDILVVDEAGMVDSRTMKRLIELTDTGMKLVLIGDYKQLQAIHAGAPFRGISERVGCFELTRNARQYEEWSRKAVSDLRVGNALDALKKYEERGLLTVADDRDEAMEKLVSDWAREFTDPKQMLIFGSTNYETKVLNRLCQRERMLMGELSHEQIAFGDNDFHVGDRVLFRRNNSSLLVRNGTMGTVVGISTERKSVRVQLDDDFVVEVNKRVYEHLDLGYCVTTHKGQGMTVEKSFVLAGGAMTYAEMAYVQASRARGTTRFYADALSTNGDIAELAKQMSRSRAKALAHDYSMEIQ